VVTPFDAARSCQELQLANLAALRQIVCKEGLDEVPINVGSHWKRTLEEMREDIQAARIKRMQKH